MGSVRRGAADTGSVEARGNIPVEISLVLEGEREGLPVYCTTATEFRVDGRAIPSRMAITPDDAGVSGAEIHWALLRPTAGANGWTQKRLPGQDGRWQVSILDLPTEDGRDALRGSGTARYAAAASVVRDGRTVIVGTSGWEREPHWENPDHAPGFRISRYHDDTLAGRALSYVGLPVVERATVGHVREKIAVRSVDIVLGALADLATKPLPTSRDLPLTDPAWSWMFETIYTGAHRRELPGLRVVSAASRGIPWADMTKRDAPGVRRSDVLLLEGGCAIADSDDGDGWLGNGDNVVHATGDVVDRSHLEDVAGKSLTVLRPRDFRQVRIDLQNAGYGTLGQRPDFDARLEQACREFQRDRDLPESGVPDADTLAALALFLERLEAADR